MSATATYTPIAGSAPFKVIEFLRANTGAQLDADQVASKCDCDRRSVHTLMAKAVASGMLVRVEDLESGELVYRLGKGRPVESKAPLAGGIHGWLERKGEASAEGLASRRTTPASPAPATADTSSAKSTSRFWIDTNTVRIDKGVPIPGRGGSRAIDWNSLFSRMNVGDSFLLPAAALSAVSTARKAFKDATNKVVSARKVEDGIRVWRVK